MANKLEVVKTRKYRPYRVEYFDIDEMQGDKAVVHFRLVRTPTAREAKEMVGRMFVGSRIVIRAFRFYKKLPKENPAPVAIETLFPGVKAVEVMERVEQWNHGRFAASGPYSPATQAVLSDLRGMDTHDQHEQLMDTFVPAEPPPANFPSKSLPSIGLKTEPCGSVFPTDLLIAQPAPNLDRTLNMMEYAAISVGEAPGTQAPAPGTCPAHRADKDAITDTHYLDCPACVPSVNPSSNGRWLFPVIVGGIILILTAIYIYQHLPN